MKIILKEEFILDSETKKRIQELDSMFFENEHELLRGKKLSKKISEEIKSLYYKYLSHIQKGWATTMLDLEKENIKNDPFVSKNSNKTEWIMIYMLSWLSSLDMELNIETAFRALDSREANQLLLSKAYEVKR